MGLDNPLHIAFLVVILLLVFGAKRLPEIGRSLGSGMREFKTSVTGEANHALPPSTGRQPAAPAQAQQQPPAQAPAAAPPPAQVPVAEPVATPSAPAEQPPAS